MGVYINVMAIRIRKFCPEKRAFVKQSKTDIASTHLAAAYSVELMKFAFELSVKNNSAPSAFWALVPRFCARLLIIKVGIEASYGRHSDASFILNSPNIEKPTFYHDGNALPTVEQMFVPTFCLARDNYNRVTKLEHWSSVTPQKGEQPLSVIFLGQCHIHLQGFRAQKHYGHSSKLAKLADGSYLLEKPEMTDYDHGATRVVGTTRPPLDPFYEKEAEAYELGIYEDGYHPARTTEKQRRDNIYTCMNATNVVDGVRDDSGARTAMRKVDRTRAKEMTVQLESFLNVHYKAMFDNIDDDAYAATMPQPDFDSFSSLEKREMLKYFHAEIPVHGGVDGTIPGIKKAVKFHRLEKMPLIRFYSRCDMIERMMMCEEPRLPQITYTDKDGKRQVKEPVIVTGGNRFLVDPLQVLHNDDLAGATDISGKKDVSLNRRSKNTMNPKTKRVLVMSKVDYKDGFVGVSDAKNFWVDVTDWDDRMWEARAAGEVTEARYERDFKRYDKRHQELCIEFRGSGGSNQKAGAHSFSNTSTPNDAHWSMNQGQDIESAKNMALFYLQRDKSPFLLAFSQSDFVDHLSDNKDKAKGKDKGKDKAKDKAQASKKRQATPQETEETEENLEDDVIANPDDSDASDDDKEDEYFSLSYWRVRNVIAYDSDQWELSRLEHEFQDIEDYLRKNIENLTYKNNGFIEAELVPAFSLRCILRARRQAKLKKAFKVVKLDAVSGKRLLGGSSQKLKEHKWSKLPAKEQAAYRRLTPDTDGWESIPDCCIHVKDYVSYLREKSDDDFLHFLDNQQEEFPEREKEYNVSLPGLVPVMIEMMVAAAYRSFRKLCVITSKSGKSESPAPLHNRGSERLSDSMRQSAKPCPAPEYDIINALFHESSRRCNAGHQERCNAGHEETNNAGHEETTNIKLEPVEDFPGSYMGIDLTVPANAKIFKDHLLMAVTARHTGRANVLSKFPAWRDEYRKARGVDTDPNCPFLPTVATLDEFIIFVKDFCGYLKFSNKKGKKHRGRAYRRRKFSSSFISGQINTAIPDSFSLKNPKKFCIFLKEFAERLDYLVDSLRDYDGGESTKRMSFLNMLRNQIDGLTKPGKIKKLNFQLHKAMADVEMIFHGCFGEVTPESIGTGAGGLTGLHILTKNDRETRGKSTAKQLSILHKKLSDHLSILDDDTLMAMGFTRLKDDRIVSAVTGAEYCATHTEHICCKVYVYCTSVHTSRTISDNPRCWNYYCWPVPGSPPWEATAQARFQKVLDAFDRIDAKYRDNLTNPQGKGYLEENIPPQLRYGESYFVVPEPEEEPASMEVAEQDSDSDSVAVGGQRRKKRRPRDSVAVGNQSRKRRRPSVVAG